jgi:uncharacterized protein (TIGR02646 family)
MRQIERGQLPPATRRILRSKQALCHDVPTARAEWKSFRSTAAAKPVLDELRRMAGATERCSYCADARGSDIDHYLPISPHFDATFLWRNHLLVCTPCNRQKSSKPPIGGDVRVLLDPTLDDPWAHFTYVTATGLLAPRFDATGQVDRMGEETLTIIEVINHDAVAEGRLRAARRLRSAVERAIASGDSQATRRDLLYSIKDDPYGLAIWFTAKEGRYEDPFASLALADPRLWRRFCSWAGRR